MRVTRRGFFAGIASALVALRARINPKPLPSIPLQPWPKIIASPRQSPGRIDFINLKQWYRIETKASDYYEPGRFGLYPITLYHQTDPTESPVMVGPRLASGVAPTVGDRKDVNARSFRKTKPVNDGDGAGKAEPVA